MHGLNTSVPPTGRGAPKPPEGVSFGELASVRKTPRTSQRSAQNSSAEAWEVGRREVGQRTTAGLSLQPVCGLPAHWGERRLGIRPVKTQGRVL